MCGKTEKEWNIRSMRVDEWDGRYVGDRDDGSKYGCGRYGNCGYDRYDSDSD